MNRTITEIADLLRDIAGSMRRQINNYESIQSCADYPDELKEAADELDAIRIKQNLGG